MKRTLIAIAIALTVSNASALGHLASIDVYDRALQRNLPVYWHHGKHYIAGEPGHEYQIRARSHAGQDVLAVVSVDGVNIVTGETANTQQGGYVVDAWQALDIAGWRKNLDRTAAFYFTSLGDSYAARTGRPNNVGVIGVAMYRRKAEPIYYAPPPVSVAPQSFNEGRADSSAAAPTAPARAEEKSIGERGMARDRIGTGHGRQEHSPARYTSFERATSYPEETVTLYYDSYANLVARGVIREPWWQDPWRNPWQDQRHDPRAFPGPFVPDPPR